jgi:hypothetical protein
MRSFHNVNQAFRPENGFLASWIRVLVMNRNYTGIPLRMDGGQPGHAKHGACNLTDLREPINRISIHPRTPPAADTQQALHTGAKVDVRDSAPDRPPPLRWTPRTAARCPRGRAAAPALQGSRPEVRG